MKSDQAASHSVEVAYPTEWFQPLKQRLDQEKIASPSITFWGDIFRRLFSSPIVLLSILFIFVTIALAIFVPILSPYAFDAIDYDARNLPPGKAHWFGTDQFGRDMWVRVWVGARISLFIAVAATMIDMLIGVVLGVLAGYRGGWVDQVIMRVIEVLAGLPWLIMVVLLIVVMGSGMTTMIVALAITGWVSMARLVRGQVLQLRTFEYVTAAQIMGGGTWHVMRKHLIPNMLGIIVVRLMMTIPGIIFTEAVLSFLGLGLKPPIASWGVLVNEGFKYLRLYPWQFWIPVAAISLTTLAFNLVGDGLRDAIDPRLRR